MAQGVVFSDVRGSIVDALCLFGDRPRPGEDAPVVQTVTPEAPTSPQHCATIGLIPSIPPDLIYRQARRALVQVARTNVWVSTVTEDRLADHLWRRGCTLGTRVLGMVTDADRWSPRRRRPSGVDLTMVRTSAQAAGFRVFRRELGEPDCCIGFYARDAVLLDAHCDCVLAVDDVGGVCGGGLTVYSPDFTRAGLFWIATAVSCRRRGIGTAVTAALASRALRVHHCRSVSLQATPAGAAVYEPMGFEAVEPYDRFIVTVGS